MYGLLKVSHAVGVISQQFGWMTRHLYNRNAAVTWVHIQGSSRPLEQDFRTYNGGERSELNQV